jgi:hypothetical protein
MVQIKKITKAQALTTASFYQDKIAEARQETFNAGITKGKMDYLLEQPKIIMEAKEAGRQEGEAHGRQQAFKEVGKQLNELNFNDFDFEGLQCYLILLTQSLKQGKLE